MRTSTIKKGHHRGRIWIGFPGTNLSGIIYLNQSMIAEEGFISKLTGISGYSLVDGKIVKNSARIGWRTIGNKLEFVTYVYNNGLSPQLDISLKKSLGVYNPIGEIVFKIEHLTTGVLFRFGDNECLIKGSCPDIKYTASPYYGGKPTAPHDIDINVKFT